MSNPVLVEITRRPKVESIHRGAICVIDGDGKTVLEVGNTGQPVFPRSAVKSIQALPLIESGAADAWGFGDKELSFACASHSGEAEHIAMARSMLATAGLDETVLECAGHWSSQQAVILEQANIYDSMPPAICNNCSGKHSGFVCTAAHMGVDPAGYVGRDHAVQRGINDALQDVTGAAHDEDICGTDGCEIPTYAVPLRALANGFARMVTGNGLARERAKAASRLLNACMNQPFYMAGTKRFCTDVMILAEGRIFAKTGAEGVFCGAIPELGVGIALKCDDGSPRGSEAMMASLLARLLGENDPLHTPLSAMAAKPITTWGGNPVGETRVHIPG